MKKKKKLSKNLLQQLSGFEEVLDLMGGRNPLFSSSLKDKIEPKFEIRDFLEIEQKRLQKILSLFKDKASLISSSPQTLSLIKKQQETIHEIKPILIEQLAAHNSGLRTHLAYLYNISFGTIQTD